MNTSARALPGLALMVSTILLIDTAVYAQEMERPDAPKDLFVQRDNGVVTVTWTQVEDATLYYLIVTTASRPDGSDANTELWARATDAASNSIDLPDDVARSGLLLRLLLEACAPPFPSPPGDSVRTESMPEKDEPSLTDKPEIELAPAA